MDSWNNDNKNRIVKYHNNLNDISVADLTAMQMNIFGAIISEITPLEQKAAGDVTIVDRKKPKPVFTYDQIRTLIGKTSRECSNKQLSQMIDLLYKGLSTARCMIHDGSKKIQFTLFPTYINDEEQQTLTVEVHDMFEYLFCGLTSHFTAFRLEEFLILRGKHEKYLYMQIRKNRGIGKVYYDFDDYKLATGISLKSDNRAVLSKIINPAVGKIKTSIPTLSTLTCSPVKEGSEHRLVGFTLTFDADIRSDLKLTGATQRKEEITQGSSNGKVHDYPQRHYTDEQYAEMERRKLRPNDIRGNERGYTEAEIKAIEMKKLGIKATSDE